jgi:hypothetical protein
VMVVTAPSWFTMSFPDGDDVSAMKCPRFGVSGGARLPSNGLVMQAGSITIPSARV